MPAGSNIDLGTIYTTSGYIAGSLNADLVPETDVSNYKWLGLWVGASSYVGELTFYGRFPGEAWIAITMYRLGNLDGAHSISAVDNETTTLYGAPIRFPLFKCTMTSYTSGAATGILELRSEGLAGLTLSNSDYQTVILTGSYYMGATTNDGTLSVAIPASTVADTVIYAGTSMLGSILVTTAGTIEMDIYDNATTGSGKIIGLVPATATVTGVKFVCHSPAANGITVKGNVLNPAVTISYTPISL